jgi:hypothetical protein
MRPPGRLIRAAARAGYGRPMKTKTIPTRSRHALTPGVAVAGLLLTAAVAACSSASSTIAPGASVALPSLVVPSAAASAVASGASAVASAGTQMALDALDKVDSAISANQAAAGLTADDVTALETLTASIRTALQTGDLTAARSAIDQLAAKVSGMSAMHDTAGGKQLADAVSALKSAITTG